MIFASAFLAALALGANAGVTVKKSEINILNSETRPGNLLPNFLFMAGSIEGGSVGVKLGGGRGDPHPFVPDDSCTDDIFEGAMEDMRSPQLPYLTQDLWGCERKMENISVVTMETDELIVTITPQYAGKVWNIHDKVRGRDLLFAKSHQPANIGALKSWAAGGSEWNWSPGIIGHSAFSETQVYLAKVKTDRGDIVRVYEFDRYNGTVWQVDMVIADHAFLAHPRITNPTDCDLQGYWWTCVAVEAKPSTRIFTPATHVAETSRDPMRDAPWPFFADAQENSTFTGYKNGVGSDMSYIGNHQIGDMFLRIPEDKVYTPYIGHTTDDGYTLIHGHPLNGTKFYTWGQSGPGRFMQDFLAGGGKREGDYAELQVGPAPTQMQSFPVPKESTREWTEWFKGFDADVDTMYGDYDIALDTIDTWMKSDVNAGGMPKETVNDWDAFLAQHASDTPDEILVTGQPWGALEEQLLGKPLAPGLTFTRPSRGEEGFDEIAPWVELLEEGTFSASTLSRLPLSYQTTDRWLDQIKKSSEKDMTWLHALHLGIALAERGDIEGPTQLFTKSLALFPNPIASRCLGVLSANADLAWPHYEQAWKILQSRFTQDPAFDRLSANLVHEMCFFLQEYGTFEAMEKFLDVVPEQHRGLDAYLTMKSKVLLNGAKYEAAAELLGSECFPTYAKARDDLMAMWNTAQEGIAADAKGSALTYVEKHQARVRNPVPENIGCQYASEYCNTYW